MISSPTHSAIVSIELCGPNDSYNELVIQLHLQMTDPGQQPTFDPQHGGDPGYGPEFELAEVEFAHCGDDGDGTVFHGVTELAMKTFLGKSVWNKIFNEACERAEE